MSFIRVCVGLQTLAPLPESWQHQCGGEGQRQAAVRYGQHHQLRPAEQDGQAAARRPLQRPHHGQLCACTYILFRLIPFHLSQSTYGLISQKCFPFKAILFFNNFLVCDSVQDESHFLKNMKTARCKAALPLMKVLFFFFSSFFTCVLQPKTKM